MSGGLGKRSKNCVGTTKILWNRDYEAYICEKCGAVIQYNFGYRYCPYCRCKVIHTDERGLQMPFGVRRWQ
jgi:hypothetical protein